MTVVRNIKFTDFELDGEQYSLDLYLPDSINYSAEGGKKDQDESIKQTDDLDPQGINKSNKRTESYFNNHQRKLKGTFNRNHEHRPTRQQYNEHNRNNGNDALDTETFEIESEEYRFNNKSWNNECSRIVPKFDVAPFVVFIHGGGWRRGYKEAWKHFLFYDINFLFSIVQYIVGTYGSLADALASNGVACAVISYPLTEASTPVIMFEMFLSYIQCVFVTLLASLPFLVTFLIIRSVLTQSTSSLGWEWVIHEQSGSAAVMLFCLGIVFLSNVAMYTVILLKRKLFKVSRKILLLSSLTFLVSAIIVVVVKTLPLQIKLAILIAVTGVFVQGVILRRRRMRRNRSYKHQLQVVSDAVSWCHRFCQRTQVADSNQMYLMGHSAGGHLATLSVLVEDVLPKDVTIQGVISLSGVYDLLCLKGRLLKYAYLLPTFGVNFEDWTKASPSHLARRLEHGNLNIKHLLLSAERDPFLKHQSLEFHGILKSRGVNSEHINIIGSNHFSIVTKTRTHFGSPLGYALTFIKA